METTTEEQHSMSKSRIGGLQFDTPNLHVSSEIEKLLPEYEQPHATSNADHLPPIKRFLLEDLLNQPVDESIYVTREIERLVANHKYQSAYDLYLSDVVTDTPESFQEFMSRYVVM